MRKVATVISKAFFGLVITAVVLIMCSSKDSGGLDVNGFLGFAIWIGLMYLLIKFRTALSVTILIILYLVVLYMNEGASDAFLYGAGLCIALAGLIAYVKHRSNIEKRVWDSRREGKKCCPNCASTNIHFVQGHSEVYSEVEWNYDYEGRHRDNVVKSNYIEGYYQCENCGKTFKRI